MAETGKEGNLKEIETMEESTETYARIMAAHKPNPLGPGYIKLYMLSAVIFLCSTMNGMLTSNYIIRGSVLLTLFRV